MTPFSSMRLSIVLLAVVVGVTMAIPQALPPCSFVMPTDPGVRSYLDCSALPLADRNPVSEGMSRCVQKVLQGESYVVRVHKW